jgi:hypothetical protein
VTDDHATCPKCGRHQPLSSFARDASKASGRKSWCKLCDCEKSLAYYYRTLDESRAKRREYQRRRRAGVAGAA